MSFPIICIFGIVEDEVTDIATKDMLKTHTCFYYKNDGDFSAILVEKRPTVIVTIGSSCKQFPNINATSYQMRNKWLHYNNIEELTSYRISNCFISGLKFSDSNNPLVTIFTGAYCTGDKIMRPFNSLRNQWYSNWEWVIFDDSDDNGETFKMLTQLAEKDYRVRVYRTTKHTGIIGKVKYEAAMLGRGEYLVELDHDDELTDNCLQDVIEAFKHYPEAGFVYTDGSEVYESDGHCNRYVDGYAFGYGGYYAQKYKGKVLIVGKTPNLNAKTIRHIVGVPNHVRVWRASFYHTVGGHSPMRVGDDYELLMRTFLKTRIIRIPKLGYIQYRNVGGNTTFTRNREIQNMVAMVHQVYEPKIRQRLLELNIKDNISENFDVYWKRPIQYQEEHATLYLPRKEKSVTVIITTFNRPNELQRAIQSVLDQTFKNFELVVIGDKCPHLDSIITKYNDPRLIWWNLAENSNDSGATPRNYALRSIVRCEYVAYLDDDNFWEPNHLETLVTAVIEKKADYAFSSFILEEAEDIKTRKRIASIICLEPKLYRIDTSALLHKFSLVEKYGYWMSGKILYSHDWELVSRWKDHSYVATGLPSLHYTVDLKKCSPKLLYEAYGDQTPATLNQIKVNW